jgi:hypothetical protein
MAGSHANQHSTSPAIDQLTKVASLLLSSALAPGSQEVYKRAARKFADFCRSCLGKPSAFPSSLDSVILFASFLFSSSFAPATIQTYVFAVCYSNHLCSGVDLAKSFLLKKLFTGISRCSAPREIRAPITISLLHRLLAKLNSSPLSDYDKLLFSAMFLLAFYGFLRVGEFTLRSSSSPRSLILQASDIAFSTQNSQPVLCLSIRVFKGNTSATPFIIYISSVPSAWCPVLFMRRYLAMRGELPGPLFCFCNGSPVSRADFSLRLTQLLAAAGVSQANIKPHSFRIGAATAACAAGVPDATIQRLGRWKSDAFKRYIRMPSLSSIPLV